MAGILEGDVILVTGGGSGIGRAAVDAFVAEGARVAVLELYDDKLAAIRADHGDRVIGIVGDATTLAANRAAVDATLAAYGRIDTLACFVGVWDKCAGLVDIPEDRLDQAFDEVYALNVKANLFAAKAALDALVASEGRIVFTISASGFIVGGGGVLYVGSKFAARGLTLQLAHELAPKVRVNAVAPGGTISDLRGPAALGQDQMRTTAEMKYLSTPLPYDPSPDTTAAVYVQLASRSFTRAMTGQILRPDGGLDIRGIARMNGNAETMMW